MTSSLDNDARSVAAAVMAHDRRLKRWQYAIAILVFAFLLCVQLVRRSFPVVLPAVREDPTVSFSASDAANLFAVQATVSLVGSVVAGPLVTKLGGRVTFALIGFVSSAALVGVSLCRIFPLFLVGVAPYRFFMSLTSPAQVLIISMWFSPAVYGRLSGMLTTAGRVGAGVVGLLVGVLQNQAHLSWPHVLWVCAASLAAATLLTTIFIRSGPEQLGLKLPERQADPKTRKDVPVRRWREIARAYVREPRLWLVALGTMAATACYELDNFIPMLLREGYGLELGQASMATAVFPCGMIVSLLVSGVLVDRLTRAKGYIFLSGLVLVTLLSFIALLVLDLFAVRNGFIGLLLLFLIGATLGAPAYLPASLFALRYGGRECGIIVAIIDVLSFLAQIACDLIFAQLTEWIHRFIVLSAFAVMCLCLLSAFFVLDITHIRHEQAKARLSFENAPGRISDDTQKLVESSGELLDDGIQVADLGPASQRNSFTFP